MGWGKLWSCPCGGWISGVGAINGAANPPARPGLVKEAKAGAVKRSDRPERVKRVKRVKRTKVVKAAKRKVTPVTTVTTRTVTYPPPLPSPMPPPPPVAVPAATGRPVPIVIGGRGLRSRLRTAPLRAGFFRRHRPGHPPPPPTRLAPGR